MGDGCSIERPLPDYDLAELVAARTIPAHCPSLREGQVVLLDLLDRRSAIAAQQVDLFLNFTESQSAAEEWQHHSRVEGIEPAIIDHSLQRGIGFILWPPRRKRWYTSLVTGWPVMEEPVGTNP